LALDFRWQAVARKAQLDFIPLFENRIHGMMA
jgi:hypothetical protein